MDQVRIGEGSRPTQRLPGRQLVLISAYWFGISAVWGAYEQFGQKQMELLVGRESVGSVMAVLEFVGAIIAILVVPTMGTISDYTVARWGRRKGYILTGSLLDLLFLTGLALLAMPEPGASWDGSGLGSPSVLALYMVCFLGLQFSSNFAQGPYQGYVPDLVPEPQVAVASGAVGVMRLVGQLVGAAVLLFGAAVNQWGIPLVVIGLLELSLAVATFLWVREGATALPRQGRSWRVIALEAWGTDVLRERSFVRMTMVRLLFMAGVGIFVNLSLLYVERALGQTDPTWRSVWLYAGLGGLLAGTVLAPIPAGRLSDRVGRKRVIRWACAISVVGILVLASAPTPPVAIVGALILGVGAGAYLAVDWALMTDIIPLAASGRYMGLANIANSISGPVGLVVGGVLMDLSTRLGYLEAGPRVAVASGALGIVLAAWLLGGVTPVRGPMADRPGNAPKPDLAPG